MSIWHLLPINDIEDHEETSNCNCTPTAELQDNGDILIIHNSFDGREAIEMFDSIVNNLYKY